MQHPTIIITGIMAGAEEDTIIGTDAIVIILMAIAITIIIMVIVTIIITLVVDILPGTIMATIIMTIPGWIMVIIPAIITDREHQEIQVPLQEVLSNPLELLSLSWLEMIWQHNVINLHLLTHR